MEREISSEDTSLYAVGRAGWDAFPIPVEDWIELPEGGTLYELPGRRGIGIDVNTGEMRLCELGWATAAFIPPAHTGLYLAAYETSHDAPTLHSSVILLPPGTIINSMYLLFASNRISARKVAASMM